MGYVPDNVVERMRGSHLLGVFIRVDTDPALHVWLGDFDIPAGIDSIDPDGTEYLGGGRLLGVPSLEILVNGKSDNVDFFMAGVDPMTGNAAIDSMPEVKGKEIQVGITTLDDYFQPMSAIIPLWTGLAAYFSEASPPVKTGQNRTLRLALSAVGGENARSRSSRAVWTHLMQVLESQALRAGTPSASLPDDDFCKNTGRLARGVQAVWPNF